MGYDLDNFFDQMEKTIDLMLIGRARSAFTDENIDDERLERIIQKMSMLVNHMKESTQFSIDISEGKLDGNIPTRQNVLASPLKQLHSQLSILTWNMRELMSGKIVPKMDDTGELFRIFNDLVDKVSTASTGSEFALNDRENPSMNSWRYHQILLAINMLHILVIEVNSDGRIVYTNHPAREILGDVEYLRPGMASEYHDELLANLALFSSEEHEFPVPRELYNKQKDSWYKIISDTFTLPSGQSFYLHMVDDITDWKKSEKELKISASVDVLTGAYNRRPGLERLASLLNNSPSSPSHCLAFVDIDGLKNINDNYGHAEGDFCIKTIANVLLSSVRVTDTVVRYGGDEFFVIFKDCKLAMCEDILTRMHEKLDTINMNSHKPYCMSFSHGIITFSYNPAKNIKELLEEADKKMYECKRKKAEHLPYK